MTQIVYNIPTTLIQRYHTHGMIVRSQAAAEIIEFRCDGIRTIFHTLQEAANDLRQELAPIPAS